jgi:hypothetical protein
MYHLRKTITLCFFFVVILGHFRASNSRNWHFKTYSEMFISEVDSVKFVIHTDGILIQKSSNNFLVTLFDKELLCQ